MQGLMRCSDTADHNKDIIINSPGYVARRSCKYSSYLHPQMAYLVS